MYRFLSSLFTSQKKKHATVNTQWQLAKTIEKNIELFKLIFKDDDMVIFRQFETKDVNPIKCCIIFVDGMISHEIINENIIAPILSATIHTYKDHALDILVNKIISSSSIKKENDIYEIICSVLNGQTLLLLEGYTETLIIDEKDIKFRSISEPISEAVVKGPREGFTEMILMNLTLIRRKIKTHDLKFKFMAIGQRTKTKVCLCYIEGIVDKKILEEINKRLKDIDIDGVLESNYIEELIGDFPFSPFRTINNTERPDVVAANLLEGRAALLVDGTPFAMTMPSLFIEYFQSNEDYYTNYLFASFNRMLRYLGFFIASSIPAIYVALTTFHQEMIPTPLLLSIQAAREGVPFPTIVEAIVMTLVFDLLRESGIRLPAPIGSTVGFVGAIILGQSAVTAKFVSAPIVIIAAITGISSFLVPKLVGALVFVRFSLIFLSGFLGLYGYIFGSIAWFVYLASMRSFGIPYMSNIGELKIQDIKDTAIRAPWWLMYYRPKLLGKNNPVRGKNTSYQKR